MKIPAVAIAAAFGGGVVLGQSESTDFGDFIGRGESVRASESGIAGAAGRERRASAATGRDGAVQIRTDG